MKKDTLFVSVFTTHNNEIIRNASLLFCLALAEAVISVVWYKIMYYDWLERDKGLRCIRGEYKGWWQKRQQKCLVLFETAMFPTNILKRTDFDVMWFNLCDVFVLNKNYR